MPFGMNLAEFPVDPLLASMLLISLSLKCAEEALTIAAMISVEGVFVTPSGQRAASQEEKRRFSAEEGDHITYLNVFNAFIRANKSSKWCYNHFINYKSMTRAVSIRNQLKRYLTRFGMEIRSCEGDDEVLRRCIVTGYFSHAAKLRPDGTYATVLHNEVGTR
ncbi:hypothetical protein BC832DRAFT_544392 [Gaertneriomyces semiglobifer]|nr:hypothetical protein BC832DRAFT_544392 [Gaertneriomyces semiglobifer]